MHEKGKDKGVLIANLLEILKAVIVGMRGIDKRELWGNNLSVESQAENEE